MQRLHNSDGQVGILGKTDKPSWEILQVKKYLTLKVVTESKQG